MHLKSPDCSLYESSNKSVRTPEAVLWLSWGMVLWKATEPTPTSLTELFRTKLNFSSLRFARGLLSSREYNFPVKVSYLHSASSYPTNARRSQKNTASSDHRCSETAPLGNPNKHRRSLQVPLHAMGPTPPDWASLRSISGQQKHGSYCPSHNCLVIAKNR